MTNPNFGQFIEATGHATLAQGPIPAEELVSVPMASTDAYEQLADRYYHRFAEVMAGMPGVTTELMANRDIKDGHQVMGRVLGLSVEAYLASQPEPARSTAQLEGALLNYKTTGNVVDSFFASPSRFCTENLTNLGLTALDYFLLRNAPSTSIAYENQAFAFLPPMVERRSVEATSNIWSLAGGYARPLWRAMVHTALEDTELLKGKPGRHDGNDDD